MPCLALVLNSVGPPIRNSILSSVSLSLIRKRSLLTEKNVKALQKKKKYTMSMARSMICVPPPAPPQETETSCGGKEVRKQYNVTQNG